YNIQSIAIPPLGCGLGGLEWLKVMSMIEASLKDLPIEIVIFEPKGAPPVKEQSTQGGKKPPMTIGRALLVALIDIYKGSGYGHTLLEVQKIMYFIKESGEEIALKFVKYKYGPYSDDLRYAMQQLDGYYITGVGDGTQRAEIGLAENALEAATDYLKDQKDSRKNLERVKQLMSGFETPYGMELLSSVHYAWKYEGAKSLKEAIEVIRRWNYRKSQLMKDQHIEKAWARLEQEGWLKF
ncbi:MAG: Appr-1-p processing protein, partial [Zetaproteobacteria bacterium]|nr:Appr-1-p processing protein [Zetaproteobacteria bacterium]